MKRIATLTKAIDLFGAGKHGFKNGDLANGIRPTDLEANWFNQVQEELCRLIEVAGIGIDGNVQTQLLQAIRRMTGGYVQTVTAGNTVLTADDAGLVLVDATAGAITIALPLASVLKALPFTFRRLDSTSNAVTISVAGVGADLIDDAASFSLTSKSDVRKIASDGATAWHSEINTKHTALLANPGYFLLPSGWIVQVGSLSYTDFGPGEFFPIVYPIAFPNSAVATLVCLDTPQGAFGRAVSRTQFGFNALMYEMSSTVTGGTILWVAFGY